MKHIVNVHQWQSGTTYRNCEHDPISDEDEEEDRFWLEPGTAAHQALQEIVLDGRLLRDLSKVCVHNFLYLIYRLQVARYVKFIFVHY